MYNKIEEKLTAGLKPTKLLIVDNSHQHAGHAGVNGREYVSIPSRNPPPFPFLAVVLLPTACYASASVSSLFTCMVTCCLHWSVLV